MGEKIRELIDTIVYSLGEIIYPKDEKCIICESEYIEGLCSECKAKIIRCNDGESFGYYGGVLKELILKFKFNGDFQCGEILGEFLAQVEVEDKIEEYIVTSIPISKKVKKTRGFNQSEYIARVFAKNKGLKYKQVLKKIKETKPQKQVSKTERKTNVENAFKAFKNQVQGKNFIIIDDVKTTGYTLMECKKTLILSGANKVRVLTVSKSDI